MLQQKEINSPFGTGFLLLLFVWKLFLLLVYKFPIEDLWHQQTLATNFTNGYGLHYLSASSADLSLWTKITLFKWPPLLSLLIGLLTQVTKNTNTAIAILDSFSLLVFLYSLKKILSVIQLDTRSQWYLWLLLFFNPVLTDLLSTSDWISLSLWLTSFYYWIQFVKKEKASFWYILFISLLAFLPAAFRFQYSVLVIVIPVYLLFQSLKWKQKEMIKRMALTTVLILILLLSQFQIIAVLNNNTTLLKEATGFYPENLSMMNPFFLNAFLPANLLLNQVSGLLSTDLISLLQSAGFLSLVLFILFLAILLTRKKEGVAYLFQQVSLVSILVLILFLSFLSVRYKQQVNGSTTFTYVQEARYWSIALVLIPILAIMNIKRKNTNFFRYAFVLILLFSVVPLFSRLVKTYVQIDPSSTFAYRMEPKNHIATIVAESLRENKRPVIMCAFDDDYALQNASISYAVLPHDTLFSMKQLRSSKPIWFFLITRDNPDENMKTFILLNNLVQIAHEPGVFRLYRNL